MLQSLCKNQLGSEDHFAVYARTSSADLMLSPEREQIDKILEFLQRHGVQDSQINVCTEAGACGQPQTMRPQLSRLLDEISTGRIKVKWLIVETFDRLGRGPEDYQLMRMMSNFDIVVIDVPSLAFMLHDQK